MTEAEIIQGCKANDRRAQKALVDTYSPYLYGICVRYAVDRAYAKDCLQESLIRIISKVDTYKEHGKFKSWMAQVTAMKCLELIRKEKKYRSEEVGDQLGLASGSHVFDKMRQEEVMLFMESLPDNYRISLNMYLVEGYNHKDIAERLNITEGSSRSLITRGRKMIQEAFKVEGTNVRSIVKKNPTLRVAK